MQTHLINGRPKRFKVDREKTLLNIFLGPTVVFIVHLTLPDQRLNTWKTEHLPPRNGNPHTHTNAQPVMSSVLHWFLYLPCPSLIVKWPITYVCWLVLARTHIEKSVGENDERKKGVMTAPPPLQSSSGLSVSNVFASPKWIKSKSAWTSY